MTIHKNLIKERHLLDNKVIALLIIAFLHHNQVITDEKKKGMLSALRDGTLLTYRNSYKCTINKKWYNDMSMLDILEDILNSSLITKPQMSIEEFLTYVKCIDSEQKNKNYCIDYIYFQIIEKIISRIGTYETFHPVLNSFGLDLRTEFTTLDEISISDYCCEDCDGDYEESKRSKFRFVSENNVRRLKIRINTILDTYCNDTYLSNPNRKRNTNKL